MASSAMMLPRRLSQHRRIHSHVCLLGSGGGRVLGRSKRRSDSGSQGHQNTCTSRPSSIHRRFCQHTSLARTTIARASMTSMTGNIGRGCYRNLQPASTLSTAMVSESLHNKSYLNLRSSSTDAAANAPIHHQTNNAKNNERSQSSAAARASNSNIPELTQRLLSMPQSSIDEILAKASTDKRTLRTMQLSPEEAQEMFILPPKLLNDIHSAIHHFSHQKNYQGISIPVNNNEPSPNEDAQFWGEDGATKSKPLSKHNKVPGPILCARLLQLIGIPALPPGDSPTLMVHSSQIDQITESCLKTTIALSRSCETGKFSLIGTNFSLQNNSMDPSFTGENKSAAQLAEEIFRMVWSMQINYTSGRREFVENVPKEIFPQQIQIGRVGMIGIGQNPLVEFLSATRDEVKEKEAIDDYEDAAWDTGAPIPWSAQDQRRYDRSGFIFNSVLAAYAKLSSTASGIRREERRDNVQQAERLLLEVASKSSAHKAESPSPFTIFQCLQPDGVSFNTVMRAWSDYSPRERQKHSRAEDNNDEVSASMASAAAERTESMLEMMQDLRDEERSNRTTLKSMQAVWDEYGDKVWEEQDHATSLRDLPRAISPNTASYNCVLKTWSRSPEPKAAFQALKVYQTMINRNNIACLARESFVLGNTKPTDIAFPDSHSFVICLQSLHNCLSSSIGFRDAVDTVESIYHSMKQWDEQMQWSMKKGIVPTADLDKNKLKPILNVFSYNTLIKALWKIPTNWEESHECCLKIDDIIEDMKCATSSVSPNTVIGCLPNVITAWAKCSEKAGKDKELLQLCAEKAGSHINALLTDSGQLKGGNENYYLVQAINDTIELYGRAGMPQKANDLYERAKECNTRNLGTLPIIIDALCENSFQDIANVEKAHQYLLDFERQQMNMRMGLVVPDMKFTSMYNAVISGYINCNMKKQGLEHARAVLAHMVSSHESNPRHIARPNTTSFARVMSVLAQRGNNIHILEGLLGKMESLHQRRKSVPRSSPDAQLVANVAPNIIIYNLLLKAYAHSNDDETLQSAMKLLGRIEKDPHIKPDKISNSYILKLLSRKEDADSKSHASSEINKLAGLDLTNLDIDNLNLTNVEPTSKSFNSIMNGYATTRTVEGAETGARLLRKLEEMHSSGEISKPDIYLYNKLMQAWHHCEKSSNDLSISPAEKVQEILESICKQSETGEEDELRPNSLSFSICIQAWCDSTRADAAERAEQVLRKKEEFVKKNDGVHIKTNDYTSVIFKWKEDVSNGPKRATLLFEEMLKLHGESEAAKPTSSTLNALLDVYAKCNSNERNLAQKAEKLLSRMNEEKGSILPDVVSYRSVIDAWIRQWQIESPQQVDALVKEMIAKYKHEGRRDLLPDSNVFNLVLKACTHSPSMWRQGVSTDQGVDHPIAIGNRIFSLLKGENEYGATATHATYSYVLQIYKHHMDFRDKRYPSIMKGIWKHCQRDGLVSKFSLSTFRDTVLEHEFWDAIGGKEKFERLGKTKAEDISVEDLPKEWRRNVVALRNRGQGKSVTRKPN